MKKSDEEALEKIELQTLISSYAGSCNLEDKLVQNNNNFTVI